MLYDLSNEYEVRKVLLRLNALIKKKVLVELKEQKPLRTISQNAYLHLLIRKYAMDYKCSFYEAKRRHYKILSNSDIFIRDEHDEDGNIVKYLRSSAELTTEEMSVSIDRFKRFAAEGGIYLPDADNLHDLQCTIIEVGRYGKTYL